MSYILASIFASEMDRYLNLQREAGRYIGSIQSSLRSLDRYLIDKPHSLKILNAEIISSWIKTQNIRARTKAQYISNINGFVKYLASLGIEANCPERPKAHQDYVPYIFSDHEFESIFSIADNFAARRRITRATLIFPILLRLLYSCGLRLGEGCSLRWKDVNLENGILTIREAKNLKQRFVPMDDSVTSMLRNYRTMTLVDDICGDYLFESAFRRDEPGKPYKNNTFYGWFCQVLTAAGIHYVKNDRRERGPCPHCIRHCFTLKSFLKSEADGRLFEDTSPFLAAYLGHDSPKETETYLSTNHTLYTKSHQRINAAIGHLFPEVNFNEE